MLFFLCPSFFFFQADVLVVEVVELVLEFSELLVEFIELSLIRSAEIL